MNVPQQQEQQKKESFFEHAKHVEKDLEKKQKHIQN